MTMFTFLLITYTLIVNLQWSEGSLEKAIGLEILPESMSNEYNVLYRQAREHLNLTCRVISSKHLNNQDELPPHILSWLLPHFLQQNSENRVTIREEFNSRQLIVENLKESDTGDYSCHASLKTQPNILLFNVTVRVNVKSKKGCGDQMFLCPEGTCINRRNLCDGLDDCKNGADEDLHTCGEEPCRDKLWCPEERRCIPNHWCCDFHVDDNCTARNKHACCDRKRYTVPEDHYGHTDHKHYNDMGFLQTTIYTVIGCAIAFMFIVTILVIVICRVLMKRSLPSCCPNSRKTKETAGGSQVPLYQCS